MYNNVLSLLRRLTSPPLLLLLLLLGTEFVVMVPPVSSASSATPITRLHHSILRNRLPTQSQAFATLIKTQTSKISKNKLDDIFYLGNGTGVVIFNKTTETPTSTYNSESNVQTESNYYPPDKSDGIICKERLEGKSYCLDVENYEQQAQLNKIRPEQFEKFKHYFNEDVIQPQNITQRMNFSPTEQEFCASKTTLLNPKSAETKDAKWMLILQDETHQQRISVELCEKESGPCNLPFELSLHYHAKCKQYYVYRTMIVVVDGNLREESFKLPNCCKCVWWQSTL